MDSESRSGSGGLPAVTRPSVPLVARRVETRLWRPLQGLALAGLVGGVWLLWQTPDRALPVFWNVVLPVVPLVLLVQPMLWRNVCPLATLNQLTGRRSGGRTLGRGLVGSGALTVVVFALVLPLRPLLLDGSGTATALLLLVSAGAALLAGLFIRDRGGFCHLVCPVLPAERVYGLAPLVRVGTARCRACSVCTPRGCPELAGEKAFLQLLGPSRKSRAWIRSFWGATFLAFPGFVLAFFILPDPWTSSPLRVYGWMWGWALGSWMAMAALAVAARLPSRTAVALAAALAFAIYYWNAVPGLVDVLGAPGAVSLPLRLVLLSVAILWLARLIARGKEGGVTGAGA